MAEEHPLALSLAAKRKASPPGTTAASVQRPASIHIERARRRNMSRRYAELAALLPDLPARATRVRILEEGIAYVRALRDEAAELEVHRAVAAGRNRAPSATGGSGGGDGAGAAEVLASGKASCFGVRLPAARRAGSLTRVLEVFHRHGVAVLAATVSSDGEVAAVTVTTSAVAPGILERIKADIISTIA